MANTFVCVPISSEIDLFDDVVTEDDVKETVYGCWPECDW